MEGKRLEVLKNQRYLYFFGVLNNSDLNLKATEMNKTFYNYQLDAI